MTSLKHDLIYYFLRKLGLYYGGDGGTLEADVSAQYPHILQQAHEIAALVAKRNAHDERFKPYPLHATQPVQLDLFGWPDHLPPSDPKDRRVLTPEQIKHGERAAARRA